MIFPWAAGDWFDRWTRWEGEISTMRRTLSSAEASASLPPQSVLSHPSCHSQMACLALWTVCIGQSRPFGRRLVGLLPVRWSVGMMMRRCVSSSLSPLCWEVDVLVGMKPARSFCMSVSRSLGGIPVAVVVPGSVYTWVCWSVGV